MMGGGLVTLEKVKALHYDAGDENNCGVLVVGVL